MSFAGHIPGPADFPEDAHLENGNYYCDCVQCSTTFVGYKRRVICKLCEEKNKAYFAAMTPEEQAKLREAQLGKVREFFENRNTTPNTDGQKEN